MDAVGEDAVPDPGPAFEQAFQVPVQLGDVPRNWYPVPHDEFLELDAGVVDVEVHPARVAGPWWSFGGHFGCCSYGSHFHETLEGVPDIVFGRSVLVVLNDKAEGFLLFFGGHSLPLVRDQGLGGR